MHQQTSLDAFESIKPELGKRQVQVLNAIRYHHMATNKQLSDFLGIPINQITPRTNELVKNNLVKDSGQRKKDFKILRSDQMPFLILNCPLAFVP